MAAIVVTWGSLPNLPSVTLPSGIDPRSPVIVGVGQHLDRDGGPEPVDLMVRALRIAEADAGVEGLLVSAEVLGVVPVVSWRYFDPARLVAEAIGASPSARWYPAMGGNTPQLLVTQNCPNWGINAPQMPRFPWKWGI